MFPDLPHLPVASRRLTGFALGLSLLGGGFSFAHSAERPTADRQTAEHPAVARPSVERPVVERRTVEGPTAVRPNTVRPAVESQMNPSKDSRPTAPARAPIRPATNAIITPRAWERCTIQPTPQVWQRRDLMAEIQSMARRGFIAVHPVGEDIDELLGVSDFPSGWKAYGFAVPPGEKIHIRLTHPNEGWFRLAMVNRWGGLEKGMLQNLIPTGNPEVSYTNYFKEPRCVYVIVDDPGWMSGQANPFKMTVVRSWDPAKKKIDAPVVTGIWAQKKVEPKPESVTKDERKDAVVAAPPEG